MGSLRHEMTPLSRLWSLSVLAAGLAFFLACRPDETKTLLEPSQALGAVLAEEAMRVAGANKSIAVISHDDSWGPPSPAEQAFKAALEKQGFSAFTAKSASLGDPMGRGGVGLQPDDFLEAVQKAAGAGAIVSFAGAPLLKPEDAPRLPPGHPPILIVATRNLGGQLGGARQTGAPGRFATGQNHPSRHCGRRLGVRRALIRRHSPAVRPQLFHFAPAAVKPPISRCRASFENQRRLSAAMCPSPCDSRAVGI
jgi:hypothetical protein